MSDAIIDDLLAIRKDASYTTETSMDEYSAKFKLWLADPVAHAKSIREPVPEALANKLDGWLRARLGVVRHRSWRTVCGTGRGNAAPKMAQCYLMAEDSVATMKKKLEEEIVGKLAALLKPKSVYNAAHMAEAHEMKRLPNGAIWLICVITVYTPPSTGCVSGESSSNDD